MTYACPPGSISANAGFFRAFGAYTGNGASQSISLGFRPAYIHVVNIGGAVASRRGGFKTPSMVGNNAIQHDGSTATGITITSTGFDVDASTMFNYSGDTYAYYAFF